MTFIELQRAVFDDLQYQPSPKPGVQDRVRRWINEGLDRTLRRPRLKSLRLSSLPLASVAGQGVYGMPNVMERIDYIVDLTNNRRLRFRSRDWYRNLDPSVMSSGTPSVWISEGVAPVRRQPRLGSASDGLWVKSSNPADTTQALRWQGLGNMSNNIDWAGPADNTWGVILNGTTPVKVAQPGWVQITRLSLDAPCLGNVYLYDKSTFTDADEMLVIPAAALSREYFQVRLFPTPATAISYQIEGQLFVPKLQYDADVPPFPADYHELLACYARARYYRKDGRLTQSQMEMQEYERFVLDLTAHIEYPPNYRPVAGKLSAEGNRWSDLGPDYPADRFGIVSD